MRPETRLICALARRLPFGWTVGECLPPRPGYFEIHAPSYIPTRRADGHLDTIHFYRMHRESTRGKVVLEGAILSTWVEVDRCSSFALAVQTAVELVNHCTPWCDPAPAVGEMVRAGALKVDSLPLPAWTFYRPHDYHGPAGARRCTKCNLWESMDHFARKAT